VVTLAELAHTQHKDGVRVLAACGIGMPDRFFGMLDAAGLKFDTLVLADHYPFKDNPFSSLSFDCALITEKDAVKCRANPALAADGRICVVPLSATLDAGLIDLIEARLRGAPHTDVSFALAGTTHGSSPA
jgi:tetraacyldisaccharide 4'-kinase